MMMKSLEEISLFALPIKESEITYFFPVISLKGEVLKIMPIQKKTCADQCVRFKASAIKDYNRYVTAGTSFPLEPRTWASLQPPAGTRDPGFPHSPGFIQTVVREDI
ncbi:40S ribosomal protein S2 [Myotis brandtii]|uniref:40S ribosomal protein S2 n=1 Tax=Myotis brandtii TaxID=109478 RepID=S7NN87_MYOBR|nr:40S ribosomal protein S2 [Myotis brandtii]